MSKVNYKKFDWDYCSKNRNPEKCNWLRDNHDKPITEDEFVVQAKKLKEFSPSSGKVLQKHYSPSGLRREYRNLRDNFGFFNNSGKMTL